ncbi:MAG: 2-hydroxyacyl-CoA dehydratase subunit D [Thermodesulfobacteriota bacterium]
MDAAKWIDSHLKSRLGQLERARAEGRKIVGYLPGGYFPEELALASGAIPVCLIRGGEHWTTQIANAYVSRWIDTFCRAQIGYAVSGKDPYYRLLDLLVIPVTDNNVRAVSDVLGYHTSMDVFPFGVPHVKEESSRRYYLHGITRLRERLEAITGTSVTEERLRGAIALCNRERRLLREISLMRKADSVPLSARQFVWLNHASMLCDKEVIVGGLEGFCQGLKGYQDGSGGRGPRVLLTGSTLAMGDDKVLDLLEDAGATVVVEEFAEGIRPYWEEVDSESDPMEALADCYFVRRVAPAWFRPGDERHEFLIGLAKEFRVKGVVWYCLMYRESYKIESHYFREILQQRAGLPMLVLESDYDPSETGPMRTRVEAFVQTLGSK